jgi:hypothetical protein
MFLLHEYKSINYKWLKNIKLDDNKAKITEFTILHQKNNKIFYIT